MDDLFIVILFFNSLQTSIK